MKQLIALIVAVSIAAAGCGDDDASPSTTEPAAATTTTVVATTTTEARTPTDLGNEIGEIYVAAYGDVVALLADRPDAGTAAEELAALKESYIQRLVALGREREALSTGDRATVDARINIAVNGVPADVFGAYQETIDAYAGEPEVADLIRSFNIIGQYANFDLLREQEPEEAERLGVG